ncbi:hypothetical protein OQA88_7907 [Cercophora sp. LCS_1]
MNDISSMIEESAGADDKRELGLLRNIASNLMADDARPTENSEPLESSLPYPQLGKPHPPPRQPRDEALVVETPSDSRSVQSFEASQEKGNDADAELEAPSPHSPEVKYPAFVHNLPPLNSGVRYYNYQGFVSRVEGVDWDYTIEVLLAKHDWDEEIVQEEARRWGLLKAKKAAEGEHPPTPPKTLPPSLIAQNGPLDPRLQEAVMASSAEDLGENRRVLQVRIRSLAVLNWLSELTDWDDNILSQGKEQQVVFYRPFATFRHCHSAMKKKLADMEKAESGSSADDNGPAKSTPSDEEEPTKRSKISAQYQARVQSTPLEDLRLYVEFVETQILPLWARYETVAQAPKKVFYDEIPFLFKPGELAYVQDTVFAWRSQQRKSSALQKIFRIVYCKPREAPYDSFTEGKFTYHRTPTSVELHYLDYDGEGFKASYYNQLFDDYFEGEREITSLPCYPLKFHTESDKLLEHVEKVGRLFRSSVEGGVRHHYYSGWTLTTNLVPSRVPPPPPTERNPFAPDPHPQQPPQMVPYYGAAPQTTDEPEHVESEVVIDFKEASRHVFEPWTGEAPEFATGIIDGRWLMFSRLTYFSRDGISDDRADGEVAVIQETKLHVKEAAVYFKHDKWLQRKESQSVSPAAWDATDYAVLPRRVLGYVLRERKFARLDVQAIQQQRQGRQATLDDIKMKASHRNIIRSTVSSHFDKKEKERNHDIPIYQPDVIQGKGRGVVILLHGAPGVGKTCTAEAVASENEKPLFPITCGDLGVRPETVEKTLKDIFRYAHLWDCVLLLDEADVFLTQRDRTDVERNALVSVFLRVLEYYSGILFLTTNRVGALDEAFRSRVHISLYYPHLSERDTLAILKDNLDRLPRVEDVAEGETPGPGHIQIMDEEITDFIQREYSLCHKKHKRGPWNGRQIRNAVQIASCLAFYEAQSKGKNKNVRAVLTAKHFETVADTTAEFDRYLKQARRADEAKLAHMQGDRYDRFDEDQSHVSEPFDYEPSFRRGGPARNQGRTQPVEPPRSTWRRSPSFRSPTRKSQYLTPRDSRGADEYERGYDRSSERRRPAPRPRGPEGDHHDESEDDHEDAGRGERIRDNPRSRPEEDERSAVPPSARRGKAPAPRRDEQSQDEEDGDNSLGYNDRRRNWEDTRDVHKPSARGKGIGKGQER